MKHKWNMDYIHEGKIYKSINGIVDLPVRMGNLNPLEEEKRDLVAEAESLGLKGEELSKFKKKNKEAKIKHLDKLKEGK